MVQKMILDILNDAPLTADLEKVVYHVAHLRAVRCRILNAVQARSKYFSHVSLLLMNCEIFGMLQLTDEMPVESDDGCVSWARQHIGDPLKVEVAGVDLSVSFLRLLRDSVQSERSLYFHVTWPPGSFEVVCNPVPWSSGCEEMNKFTGAFCGCQSCRHFGWKLKNTFSS